MGIEVLMKVAQVLIAVAMIAIILVQRGAGASAGAGFGAGASGTVFGARGSGNFLSRSTAILAACFFALTMAMGVVASRSGQVEIDDSDLGVMSGTAESTDAEIPSLPGLSGEEGPSEVPVLETPAAAPESPVDDAEATDDGDQAGDSQ